MHAEHAECINKIYSRLLHRVLCLGMLENCIATSHYRAFQERHIIRGEASCGPGHSIPASFFMEKHNQQCVDTGKEVHLCLNKTFLVFPAITSGCRWHLLLSQQCVHHTQAHKPPSLSPVVDGVCKGPLYKAKSHSILYHLDGWYSWLSSHSLSG